MRTGALGTSRRTERSLRALAALIAIAIASPSEGCAPGPAGPAGESAEAAPESAGRIHAAPSPVERALAATYPEHAARILHGDDRFAAREEGFALPSGASRLRRLDLVLPRRAEGRITARVAGGFEISVREIGTDGEGALAGAAVAYSRAGGTSLWTAAPGGFEEWLLLEAGAARGGVVASWEIDGGTPREANGAIGIFDGAGVAKVWVTAPVAFTASGRAVEPRLSATEGRIELAVDAQGEAVLVDPAWMLVAPMAEKRASPSATVLLSGKVLVAGGSQKLPSPHVLASAEIYDPALNVWSAAAPMSLARAAHTATLLADGRVLVTGGFKPLGFQGSQYFTSVEVYDPVTNTWSAGGPLGVERSGHFAVPLPNGIVLIVGGTTTLPQSAELYDPAALTSAPAASMSEARLFDFTATLLANGEVLVAGGYGTPSLATTEVYDPATDTWTSTAPMSQGRYGHTATLLPGGGLLIAGGLTVDPNGVSYAGAEIYDAVTDTWSPAGAMLAPRYVHRATSRLDGSVLIEGGYDGMYVSSAELYDPVTGTWASAGSMGSTRYAHAAALLPGGSVVVLGGVSLPAPPNTETALATAETFGLSAGEPCSSAAECLAGSCADGVCCDTACDAGPCDACSVAAGADVDGACKLLTGPACDDGSACSQVDACQSGVCVGGSLVSCAPLDECHGTGTCDPASGQCSTPIKPDGSPCAGGSCSGGECLQSPGTTSGAGGSTAGAGGAGGESTTGAGGAGGLSTTGAGGLSTTSGVGGGATAGAGGAGGLSTTGAGGDSTTSGVGGGSTASAGGAGGDSTTGAGGQSTTGGGGQSTTGAGGAGGGATTGGNGGGATGGTSAGGSDPGDGAPGGRGNCGCDVPGGRGSREGWLFAGAGLLLVLVRRRRLVGRASRTREAMHDEQ